MNTKYNLQHFYVLGNIRTFPGFVRLHHHHPPFWAKVILSCPSLCPSSRPSKPPKQQPQTNTHAHGKVALKQDAS